MKSKLRWKASLLERRKREATTLSEEDVEFLVINTRFSVEDIREWYRQFILECPQVCKFSPKTPLNYLNESKQAHFHIHITRNVLTPWDPDRAFNLKHCNLDAVFVLYRCKLFQGRLEKNKVEEMLEGLLPGETVDTVSNLIFSTFDKDNRGSLSFVEFVSSIHCMSNSSPEVSSA